jgi:hypothetical protein
MEIDQATLRRLSRQGKQPDPESRSDFWPAVGVALGGTAILVGSTTVALESLAYAKVHLAVLIGGGGVVAVLYLFSMIRDGDWDALSRIFVRRSALADILAGTEDRSWMAIAKPWLLAVAVASVVRICVQHPELRSPFHKDRGTMNKMLVP